MDTGRAGAIYGQSVESLLGVSFFAKNDLLPRGFKIEALHDFPAPDFQSLGAGSLTITKSRAAYAAVSSSRGAFGWNFSANKTKALFVVAHVHATPGRSILLLNDDQPTDNEAAGAKAIGFRSEVTGSLFDIGTVDVADGWDNSAGWTQLALGAGIYSPLTDLGHGMAVYIDTAGGGIIKAFVRLGFGQWIEIISTTSAHLAGVIRCATLLASPTLTNEQGFGTPIGIYAE